MQEFRASGRREAEFPDNGDLQPSLGTKAKELLD
jgi:hypothetical protein